MADISKIQILDGTYDVKDSTAREEIGTLSSLTTSVKTDLVSAINELNTTTTDDVVPFYCIARPTSNGWTILNDSEHTPLNVQSIEIDSGRLKINHSVTGASKIYSFSISPDETFTKYGIRAGASVGINYSFIDIYQTITANAYFRYSSGGVFNLQAGFSNLVKSYEYDTTNHCLRVTFDDNLRCSVPKEWGAEFNYAPVQTSQFTTKLKTLWVNYNILEVYAFDEDNTLLTDPAYLDRVNVIYKIDSKIAPADLITYPISGSNFWICGYLKKTS